MRSLPLLLAGLPILAANTPQLLRQPALSATQIVFQYAGDLWTVPRDGGDARRLTASPGEESDPYFSPDGTQIAFTAEYDGNKDVYVMPAAGGVPRRITFHPGMDVAQGWTPDGKRVLFRSARNMPSRGTRLYSAALDGATDAASAELPFPLAVAGAFSPTGDRIAYEPLPPAFSWWKRYRGGRMSKIWIGNLSDSATESIPRTASNDFNPMWVDDKVYFLSDREGPFTLFSYDTKSRKVQRLLANTSFDFKSASAASGAIAYEQFGSLHLYDIRTAKSKPVPVTINADLLELRPRLQKLTRIESAHLSPSGARAVFESRGEILTVPAAKGDVRNLSASPGAADRTPAWSPDGRWVASFSDESGEYELVLRDPAGQGQPKRLPLTRGYYYTPVWSPDSKLLAFTDQALHTAFIDIATGKITTVDTDRYMSTRRPDRPAWSPDSRWLAYTKQEKSSLRRVHVYSVANSTSTPVTDGLSDAWSPAFDRDGKHLYFLASTNTALGISWRDMSSYDALVTATPYVAVLRKDLPSPLAPESDEERPAAKEPKPDAPVQTRIDFDGINNRILALPAPARHYDSIQTAKPGVVFLLECAPAANCGNWRTPGTLQRFDLKTRKTDRFLDQVTGFELSANGEKLLLAQTPNRWRISGSAKADETTLKVDGLEAWVDPRAEWRQMYHEAWRIQRDFFYDPKLHGVDIKAMEARYEPFLAQVGSREDLNYLMGEMMGEFSAGHLYILGGQKPEVRAVPGGLLGCDFTIENGRYRFTRIYTGENWNPDARAPLTEPGVNVVAGEYLYAINGRPLSATANIYQLLEATAGKQVTLRVGPSESEARNVTVVPIPTEQRLRYLDWIESNRRTVDRLSGGKLAYVHLPDTSRGGYNNFNRYYFAQIGKQGAVIDERFNAGGHQPDYIIDHLHRPLMHYRSTRYGERFQGPFGAIHGPKVMLINEFAGSGGDSMPWYFRKAGVGKLVGKTTWGGLIGNGESRPVLIDGGAVTVPAVAWWDAVTGERVAENIGIHPDLDVELDPKAWRAGHDLQLERAISSIN